MSAFAKVHSRVGLYTYWNTPANGANQHIVWRRATALDGVKSINPHLVSWHIYTYNLQSMSFFVPLFSVYQVFVFGFWPKFCVCLLSMIESNVGFVPGNLNRPSLVFIVVQFILTVLLRVQCSVSLRVWILGVATADFPSPFGSNFGIPLRHFSHCHVLSHRIHKPPFRP